MMKKFTLIAMFMMVVIAASAQSSEAAVTEKGAFSYKPVVTIFANHATGLDDMSERAGFQMDRAYLGYSFKYQDEISGSIIFDVASTGLDEANIDYVAHIKNVFLTWKKNDVAINFGLIKTNNYSFQESSWGYRYIMKSFQDEYSFAPSADFGFSVGYKPLSWLDLDFSLTNGKGNKSTDMDASYRYGLGSTFHVTDELSFRLFYDMYTTAVELEGYDTQHIYTAAVAYKTSNFTVGAEYVHRENGSNNIYNDGNGFSAYSSVKLASKLSVFGRYDSLTSIDNYSDKRGEAFVAGVEYTPYKYLKFAPNYSSWTPEVGANERYFTVNMQFKF